MNDINREKVNKIRGVLIILVVFGHFLQYIADYSSGTAQNIIRALVLLIYSFHMPLFVGVSGFLSINPEKRRDAAVKTLLLPYLLFQPVFGVVRGSVGGTQ